MIRKSKLWVAIVLLVEFFSAASSEWKVNNGESENEKGSFPACELLDLCVMIDSNPSIGRNNFRSIRTVFKSLLSRLNVGLPGTRVSALRFSSSVFPLWTFLDSKNRGDMKRWVDRVIYDGRGAFLSKALEYAFKKTFSPGQGNRPGIPDIILVFSDGKSEDDPTAVIQQLRRRGVRIMVVGVGRSIRMNVLSRIASEPRGRNIFRMNNFNQVMKQIKDSAVIPCPHDENECIENNGGCVDPAVCIDLPGSHKCACPEHLRDHQIVNGTFCDRDECQIPGICSHACHNTIGSYVCLCPPTMSLLRDGKTCDYDECDYKNGHCSSLASCINTLDSYQCVCREGYTLFGNECDIDECSQQNGGCSHYCTNTFGSYYCSCPRSFSLDYDHHQCVKCGFDSKANQDGQILHSPGWPLHYENNISCTWNLWAEKGRRIKINFDWIDIETCCDVLLLREDGEESAVLVGNLSRISFVSKHESLSLYFESDCSVNGAGFHATFTETENEVGAPCGFSAVASSSEKAIASPDWPRAYLPMRDCQWTIRARPGFRVQITFHSFDMEEHNDYLDIIEDNVELFRLRGTRSFSEAFVSNSDLVTLRFSSNEDVQYSGFYATFKETTQNTTSDSIFAGAPCGFLVNASEAVSVLFSPGWPMSYDDNLDCDWTIFARKNNRIHLEVISFQTEADYDYFLITDADKKTILQGQVPKNYSYVSNSENLILHFHTDMSIGQTGFQLKYKETSGEPRTIPPKEETVKVHYVYSVAATVFTKRLPTPAWPTRYSNGLNCSWSILARPGYRIQLNFHYFETEKCCDYLTIEEGTGKILQLQGVIQTPARHISSTARLLLRFVSDETVTKAGFHVTYRETWIFRRKSNQLYPTCGFFAIADSVGQTFFPPGWPGNYAHKVDCEWFLQARRGHQIKLKTSHFKSESCCDYIDIDDGKSEITRLTGNLTYSGKSAGGILVLRFHSDDSISKLAFQANFKEVKENFP